MIHHRVEPSDVALLQLLTSDPLPATPSPQKFARRDAALDPLLLAAAAASGPHMTRNHYAHDFYPAVQLHSTQPQVDWTKWSGLDASVAKQNDEKRQKLRLAYTSRQAPRKERLGLVGQTQASPGGSATHSKSPEPAHNPISQPYSDVEVKCMARTRIPTSHGPVFLHLYHNNRDNKEHLALVVDSAQLDEEKPSAGPHIRSASLDAQWSPSETEADRLLRGAYVGRLSTTSRKAAPPPHFSNLLFLLLPTYRHHSYEYIPSALLEKPIGSMRCDCGEQLDEAIRQIARPQILASGAVIPGRGAWIGLLSKIRAYNLQDMGHDTRRYDVAAGILRDLGLGSSEGESVRVLTNNPDKLQALEKEGLPGGGTCSNDPSNLAEKSPLPATPPDMDVPGATMIGGNAVSGPDLEKYLRTKVLRMGHILPLWMGSAEV
ncbi:cyclohydrolase [Flagelloscypha sp. PMI_526]|nr:cyclohydrolase [Flagelloscypha sp. PMI_526]